MSTSRSMSASPGVGANRRPFAAVKIAALAPMPIASDRTAVIVNAGVLKRRRNDFECRGETAWVLVASYAQKP